MNKIVVYGREQTEKHHVIPVSIWWQDIPENIVVLSKQVHKYVHKILNLPYSQIRELRMISNDPKAPIKDVYRKEVDIQKRYFWNLDSLEDEVREMHINSLLSQIARLKYELYKLYREKNWI